MKTKHTEQNKLKETDIFILKGLALMQHLDEDYYINDKGLAVDEHGFILDPPDNDKYVVCTKEEIDIAFERYMNKVVSFEIPEVYREYFNRTQYAEDLKQDSPEKHIEIVGGITFHIYRIN